MASAFRCYVAFCELRHKPPSPAQEEIALQRSSIFNNAATCGNYISHLQKCFYFLRFRSDWLTHAVRHDAKGLKKRQNKSSRFHNLIRSPLSVKIIGRDSFAESEQEVLPSFLFSFRVQSGTLQLIRAYSSDALDTCPINLRRRWSGYAR